MYNYIGFGQIQLIFVRPLFDYNWNCTFTAHYLNLTISYHICFILRDHHLEIKKRNRKLEKVHYVDNLNTIDYEIKVDEEKEKLKIFQ